MRRKIVQTLEARSSAAALTADEPSDEFAVSRGTLDKEYIQQVISDEMIPLARECYELALERTPAMGGSIRLSFNIMGDASVGGIVDDVLLAEGSEITDEEMTECIRESMAATTFEPPQDGGVVAVTYPFVFMQG